jgi:hypothetical protein
MTRQRRVTPQSPTTTVVDRVNWGAKFTPPYNHGGAQTPQKGPHIPLSHGAILHDFVEKSDFWGF